MAICKIFEKLLSVQPLGVIPALMKLVHLKPIAFLSSFEYALTCITLIDGYKFCGLYMVIFYAALMKYNTRNRFDPFLIPDSNVAIKSPITI